MFKNQLFFWGVKDFCRVSSLRSVELIVPWAGWGVIGWWGWVPYVAVRSVAKDMNNIECMDLVKLKWPHTSPKKVANSKEILLFQGSLGWWKTLIWPDIIYIYTYRKCCLLHVSKSPILQKCILFVDSSNSSSWGKRKTQDHIVKVLVSFGFHLLVVYLYMIWFGFSNSKVAGIYTEGFKEN